MNHYRERLLREQWKEEQAELAQRQRVEIKAHLNRPPEIIVKEAIESTRRRMERLGPIPEVEEERYRKWKQTEEEKSLIQLAKHCGVVLRHSDGEKLDI